MHSAYNSENLGVFWVLLAEKDFDQLDNLDVQELIFLSYI